MANSSETNKIPALVDPEEEVTLRELEQQIGLKLEQVEEMKVVTRGYKVEKGKIVSLSLTDCNLTQLPKALEKLIHLKSLGLRGNAFKQVPVIPKTLKNLKVFDIGKNPLDLPTEGAPRITVEQKITYVKKRLRILNKKDVATAERRLKEQEKETRAIIQVPFLGDTELSSFRKGPKGFIADILTKLQQEHDNTIKKRLVGSLLGLTREIDGLGLLNTFHTDLDQIYGKETHHETRNVLKEILLRTDAWKTLKIPTKISFEEFIKLFMKTLKRMEQAGNNSQEAAIVLCTTFLEIFPQELKEQIIQHLVTIIYKARAPYQQTLRERARNIIEVHEPGIIKEISAIEDLENAIRGVISLEETLKRKEVGLRIENNHVVELVCNGCNLSSLPESFSELGSLERLSLWHNQFTIFPEIITQLPNLRFLMLGWNPLRTLPGSISKMNNLRELNLYDTKLTVLPESFGNLNDLTELTLSMNPLTALPESFGNLINLQILEMWNTRLKALPEPITRLKKLRNLKISENNMESLNDSIADLSNLEELYLSKNQLTTVPESLGNLSNIRILDLQQNKLITLPESVGQLENLQDLNLAQNPLKTFPDSIVGLNNLKKIDLRSTQLTTFPSIITQLKKLQELLVGWNQLNSLPVAFENMIGLKKLHLEANQFTTLPKVITQLKNLELLDISRNQLSTLPESFGSLNNLEWLNLSENRFSIFPEPITQLTALQTLVMENNQLTSLPMAITQLSNLQNLSLGGNTLQRTEYLKIINILDKRGCKIDSTDWKMDSAPYPY